MRRTALSAYSLPLPPLGTPHHARILLLVVFVARTRNRPFFFLPNLDYDHENDDEDDCDNENDDQNLTRTALPTAASEGMIAPMAMNRSPRTNSNH